jgi:hypothetical protein
MDEICPEFHAIFFFNAKRSQDCRDCPKDNLVNLVVVEALLLGEDFTDDQLYFVRLHSRHSRFV